MDIAGPPHDIDQDIPVQRTFDTAALKADVMEAICTIRDPELPVNLVDLGLIYDVQVRENGMIHIEMTLTTPACPVASALPAEVQHLVSLVPGVTLVVVDLVWEPPWSQARMSDSARLELGLV
ncbi:iron-sulfur cluster assembly protein [Niveispirillum irakense]|uniref:iron-sulfur cluster assembly protein n=1 Tax=Niveispirillum irakense TaxID=34011 RepID=UPI00040DA72A|nr:iron-sulfur cluster assembly protein [Niveispirillum irakense]